MSQPIAKGRVVYAAEHYPTQDRNQPNKQIMKARYATLGKATLWPNEQPHLPPQVSIDLDSLPIGSTGSIKLTVFWDDPTQQPQQNQQPNQPPQHSNQQPQPQPQPQPQSYGSWGNQPTR